MKKDKAKKMKTKSIGKQILVCSVLPVCMLGLVVIILVSTVVRQTILSQVQSTLEATAVATLAAYDQNSGSYMEGANGDIWKGSYNVSSSQSLVDNITENSGIVVTFFYGSTRIMTSAFDSNGDRILGSPAGDVVVEKVLTNGESYFSSNVSIDGTIYYGYYIPVYQNGDDTTPIGMVFAGMEKSAATSGMTTMTYMMIGAALVIMILGVIFSSLVSSAITKPLKRSVVTLKQVADGKLNQSIDDKLLNRQDEIGRLMRSIERLQHSLRSIVGDIGDSTSLLIGASDKLDFTSQETSDYMSNVAHAIDSITQGASTQAADTKNVSEYASHMGELIVATGDMANILNVNADRMMASSDEAANSIEALKSSNRDVQKVVAMIDDLTRHTNESAASIQRATELISDIASQTNLLSLNASIEAARAGEAGRGFAVVAEEIQKLAVQSDAASGQIDETVKALIEASAQMVDSMESMQAVIEKQNAHIDSTEGTVGSVIVDLRESVENIRGIKSRAEELESARKEILTGIESLSVIAQENAAGTQETNSIISMVADSVSGVRVSAENLRETSDKLKEHISNFEM